MRKLKLQVQITIVCFICGPNGEMDWMTFNWTDDLKEYVNEITGQFRKIWETRYNQLHQILFTINKN